MSIKNSLHLLAVFCFVCVLLSVSAGCSSGYVGNPIEKRETLAQVSTIGALLDGLYDSVVTVGELKEYGDFGIGTFEGLDGEMVILNGECYQIKADGVAYLVDNTAGVPFADITFFDIDLEEEIPAGTTYEQLQVLLNCVLPTENIFYAFKIEGTFTYMQARSVPGQEKPYPPLVEVTANQVVFNFTEVSGTIVGFYSPEYVDGVGVAGYHLHFLTDDSAAGGHILDFTVKEATAFVDYTSEFYLVLPGEGSDFYDTDFSQQDLDDIDQAEN
jgi:acetolactate decarboxylase